MLNVKMSRVNWDEHYAAAVSRWKRTLLKYSRSYENQNETDISDTKSKRTFA